MIDEDIARAQSLPPSVYIDPAMLAREHREVFARTWQLVARADQLADPGAYVTAEIGAEPVLIVRSPDGLRGYHNVCPHRAGPLATGCGRRQTIQCQYHGWTFRLDGSLLRAPEMDGCDLEGVGLAPIQVRAWGPLVFAAIDPVIDLGEQLAGITEPAPMPYLGRRDYPVACNWKVYVDNYLEGYHIPVVHPELHKELDMDAYRCVTDRWWSRQYAPLRTDAKVYRPTREGEEAEYYWVFPNLMLNVYQGQVQTNVVVPLSENRTNVIFEWFGPVREDIAAFSDLLQEQDARICEAVQRNLGTRAARRGRYSPRRENGVHHFHRLYAGLLGLALVLLVACGSKKKGGECARACDHMIELGMAEIDRLGKQLGEDSHAKLKAMAEESRDSDRATCIAQCDAGRMNAGCVLAAKSIDGAMSCTGNSAGPEPVEPPAQRSDDDWPNAPLREVSDSVSGIAFTLEIPAELQEQEADRTESSRGWDFPGWPFSQPRFRVTTDDVPIPEKGAPLDDYIHSGDTIVEQSITADELRLIYQSDTYVVAIRRVRAGSLTIECYGTHSGSNLTKPEVIGPWLAKVCATMKVGG